MEGQEEVECLCADLCAHRQLSDVLHAILAGGSKQTGKALAWRGSSAARVFVRSPAFLAQLPPPLQHIFAPGCANPAVLKPWEKRELQSAADQQRRGEGGERWGEGGPECCECKALHDNLASAEHEELRSELLKPPASARRQIASAYEVSVERSAVLLGRVHVRIAQCHLLKKCGRPPKGISHYQTVVRLRVGTSLTRSWPMPASKLGMDPRLKLPRERFPHEEQASCWQQVPTVGAAARVALHDWVQLDVNVSSDNGQVHVGISRLGGFFGALGPDMLCEEDEDSIRVEVVRVPVPWATGDGGSGCLDAPQSASPFLSHPQSLPRSADETFLSAIPVHQERRQAEAAGLEEEVLLSEPLCLRTLLMAPGFQGSGCDRKRVGVLDVAAKRSDTVVWIHDGVSAESMMNTAMTETDEADVDAMPLPALHQAFVSLFSWATLNKSRRYLQKMRVAVGTVVPALDEGDEGDEEHTGALDAHVTMYEFTEMLVAVQLIPLVCSVAQSEAAFRHVRSCPVMRSPRVPSLSFSHVHVLPSMRPCPKHGACRRRLNASQRAWQATLALNCSALLEGWWLVLHGSIRMVLDLSWCMA